MTPQEHHAKHCESRGLDRMAPYERCPFRPWHTTQETSP